MEWYIKDRVLHGTYRKKEDIPPEIIELANRYEGDIPHRTGWNFPFSHLQRHLPTHRFQQYRDTVEYIILYAKGDISTKKHELQHARYAMDEEYRMQVGELWCSLSPVAQKVVYDRLRKMGYPDRPDLLLDEFQAYYYTEKPNFFGVVSVTSGKTHDRRPCPANKTQTKTETKTKTESKSKDKSKSKAKIVKCESEKK